VSSIVFPKSDFKAINWANSLDRNNVGVKFYDFIRPSNILKTISSIKSGDVFVVRYLNDSKSVLNECLKCLCFIWFCFICKISGGRVWWFCHNIDKETQIFHPILNKSKRWFCEKISERIVVMDPLLEKYAKEIFPSKTVNSICFGSSNRITNFGEKYHLDKLISALKKSKQWRDASIRLLCVTSAQEKNKSIQVIEKLVNSHQCSGLIVYDGDIKDNLLEKLQDSFVIINERCDVSLKYWGDFDYVVKASDDLSMNFSLYNACTQEIPVITIDKGVLPSFIRFYGLGSLINNDGSISKFLSSAGYKKFLNERSWDIASDKMASWLNLY
jgi:hypothetical protein